MLFVVRAALELRDNQRYGYLVAIKYYGTVFLKVIVTIKLIDLPDNFDSYWPVIHYHGTVVMVTNWVSDVARETNDELIRMLDDNNANEVGDGGTSDAEGEG